MAEDDLSWLDLNAIRVPRTFKRTIEQDRRNSRAQIKANNAAEVAHWRQREASRPRKPGGSPIHLLAHKIASAMLPGRFYAMADVCKLVDLKEGSVKGRMSTMWRDGVLERREVKGFAPKHYAKGVQIHVDLDRPIRFLYRLTAKGEELRRLGKALE